MDKSASWDELAALNQERMIQLGIPHDRQTTEICLMQLVSCVGELSNLAFRTPSQSEFEKEEISDVLSSIALALATVAQVNGVNIGDVARRKAQSHIHRVNSRHTTGGSASPIGNESPRRHSPVAAAVGGSLAPPPPPPAELPPPAGGSANAQQRQQRPSAPQVEQQQQQQQSVDLLLSPRTSDSFFPMLDVLMRAQPSPSELGEFGLRFAVPVRGRMVDLVPNGSEIPVTAENWPKFCDLARPYRPASIDDNDAPPMKRAVADSSLTVPPAHGTPSPPVATQHIEVHAPSGYDPEQVSKLFSPGHFEMDLFSPHTNAKAFDVPVYRDQHGSAHDSGANGSSPPCAARARGAPNGNVAQDDDAAAATMTSPQQGQPSHSRPVSFEEAARTPTTTVAQPEEQRRVEPEHEGAGGGALFSPKQGPVSLSQPAPPPQQPPQQREDGGAASVGRPSSETPAAAMVPDELFWQKIAALQRGEVKGLQIRQLGLTFTLRYNGTQHPLVTNGEMVDVTESNIDTFMDLVRTKVNELEGRLTRAMSIKTIAISNLAKYNPNAERALYSPSHFSINLFAPHTTKTTFSVDYDDDASLPPNLRERSVSVLPTAQHFIDHVAKGRQYFEDVFAQVKRNPEALHRFQVTFCAIDPATDTIKDLIRDGRFVLVQPNDWEKYIQLVDELYIEHS